MRKALIIGTGVTVYCLLEVVLLLSIVSPNWTSPSSDIRLTVALGAQFVLIPGFAFLFLHLIYGSHRWKERVWITLAFSAGLPTLFGLLIAIDLLLSKVISASAVWANVLFAIVNLGFITALFFASRAL